MVNISKNYSFDIENDVKACFDDKIYDRIDIRLLEYLKVGKRVWGGLRKKTGPDGLKPHTNL